MFKIEKVRLQHTLGDEYRITYTEGSYQKCVQIAVDPLALERQPDPHAMLKQHILAGVRRLFREVEEEFVQNILARKERTGTFDTTGDERMAPPTIIARDMIRSFSEVETMRMEATNNAMAAIGAVAFPPIAFPSFEGIPFRGLTSEGNRVNNTEIYEKAMKLLKSKISRKLYKELNKKGYFELKGKHGIYQFHLNSSHGIRHIQEVDAGGKKRPIIWDLCIQSSVPNMPKGDVILARYLEFMADEDKFRKTANWRSVSTIDEAHQ